MGNEAAAPRAFQVTFDAIDPHAQARFWAAALGWEVEITTAFIQGLLDAGHASPDDVLEIGGELFWTVGAGVKHPARPADATDGSGGSTRVLFMRVPEAKQVKNRVHLDINVGPDRRDAEVARLVDLGATVLYEISEPGGHHVTLADPEGNEFCVQ